MPKKKLVETTSNTPKMRPATTPEARQNQMISLAMDLAEQQLRDGTASAQVIVQFLKLGTVQAKAELENTRLQNNLLKAKTDAIETSQRIEALYSEALKAMKEYKGDDVNHDPNILGDD